MPREYITGFISDKGHRFVICHGWMNVQGLFSFERKLQFYWKTTKNVKLNAVN